MSASGRPLPLVTEENEFFWTSGADGKLRLQECRSCASLIHPPAPVCRYCRSRDIGVRAVSGKATLAGFTVNHRFSLPGMPAPYVIAQVAIAEDPRVRLTTNIVECDPDRLELGQAVEVVFEQADDVWFPLFRPSAVGEPGPLPADEIAPERFGDHVRPMLTTAKFEDKVALTGIGMSPIGRRLMQLPLALTVQACEAAIADAGLTYADIDGLSTYPGAINVAGMGEGGVTALEAALGIRPTWHNGAMETFGPGGSVIAAMLAVAGGLARHVLCFRTLWEATHTELMKQGKITPSMGRMQGWQMPFGATSAAHTLAMNAQRHFHRYGTTKETLGWIALNQRANAELNPTAIYRSPMTMEDYLARGPSPRPSASTTATCPATARSPSSSRPSTPPAIWPSRRCWWRRWAPRSSSEPIGTKALSPTSRRCWARRHTYGRAHRCARRTSMWPSCTTGSRSTACPGSRRWDSAESVRRRSFWTAARTSPATASYRSTRTAVSFRTAAPTAWVCCTKPSPSCAARPATAKSPTPASASSAAAA